MSATFLQVLLWLLLLQECLGDEKKVYEDIFEAAHYNNKVRPRYNTSEAVEVDVKYELQQIASIDQANEIMYTTGFFVAMWTDEYIAWTPADYNGTDELIIPPNAVWLPDFGLLNSASTFYQTTFRTDFRVHVKYTGAIVWAYGGKFATSCELDLTFFPFDRQICGLTIENWAYNAHQVHLVSHDKEVHLDDYHTNGEWTLEHSSIKSVVVYHDIYPGQPFPKITFNLYLRRKPGYYVLNIIVPCLFVICMALLMFWLPAESGEKVSLGVTVLLAFSVFQLVVADSSPKTSDFVPILGLYIAFIMGMAALSTTTAVLSLYFHHHLAYRPVPNTIKLIFFKYLGRAMCMHGSIPDANNGVEPSSDTESSIGKSRQTLIVENMDRESKIDLKKSFSSLPPADDTTAHNVTEIAHHVRYLANNTRDNQQEAAIVEEWQALARVLDRVFFWLCLFVIGIVCIWMFTQYDAPEF